MTYPNMDLQSLPDTIDMRVGTDPVERAIQLSYWQLFAALQAVNAIAEGSQYPEKVVDAGEEANFDTQIGLLVTSLSTSLSYYTTIFSYVP